MKLDKKILRKEMKSKRNQLEMDKKLKMDNNIFNKLISSSFYKNSSNIFVFVSFGSEVDTIKFIEFALKENKNIYVPKVTEENQMLAMRLISLEDLDEGYYGVLEPKKIDETITPNDLDLIVLPGLAFDRNGNRLGYGGGFYDRFLNKVNDKAVLLAIAYSFQLLEFIPHEDHDFKVNYIFTDEETLFVKGEACK